MIAMTSQRTMSGGTETPTVFVMTVAKRVSHSGAIPVIPPRAMTSIAPRSTKPIPRVTTIDWTRKWWTMSPLSPPITIDAARMTASAGTNPHPFCPTRIAVTTLPSPMKPGTERSRCPRRTRIVCPSAAIPRNADSSSIDLMLVAELKPSSVTAP